MMTWQEKVHRLIVDAAKVRKAHLASGMFMLVIGCGDNGEIYYQPTEPPPEPITCSQGLKDLAATCAESFRSSCIRDETGQRSPNWDNFDDYMCKRVTCTEPVCVFWILVEKK